MSLRCPLTRPVLAAVTGAVVTAATVAPAVADGAWGSARRIRHLGPAPRWC
ncbi:hypothetical protein ABZ920_20360 [Streptomyces sp. NPDC046831]|uniref:hypothetical protein n=1 Tax=Streptomyces sp. NPDC046831 TaxID=3154805 RepID=UPI0033FCCCFE